MTRESNPGLARLRRVAHIKRLLSEVEEAAVRHAERRVSEVEEQRDFVAGQIRSAQAEISQQRKVTGAALNLAERYVGNLQSRQEEIRQDLEKAGEQLEQRRAAWVEARRDQRTLERTLERRLQWQQRKDDTEEQKAVDERYVTQLERSRHHR
jgi:flagellar export protein FliJ